MKDNSEGLSVSEILSSIRTAVLDAKAPAVDSANLPDNKEEIFDLTKEMLLKNVSASTMTERDFQNVSAQIIRKFAKSFTAQQILNQSDKRVMAKVGS